jgi:DNA-binding transcriptional LysR family regulator
MRLSSLHLQAFAAVAAELHFTKAANKIHITQSAISQRISQLEDQLKVSLFIRDRSGLKITEDGFQLVRYVQQLKQLEDSFFDRVSNSNDMFLSGQLKIASFSSFHRSVLLPSTAGFLKTQSHIKYNFISKDMADIPELLYRGEVDYIITHEKLDKQELVQVSLGAEENYLVRHKKYNAGEIYLDHDERDEITLKYLKLVGRSLKALRRRYLEDVYGLIDGVNLQLGLAVLPEHLLVAEKDLVKVYPDKSLRTAVYLYYFSQPFYSKLHDAFLKIVTEGCKKILNS